VVASVRRDVTVYPAPSSPAVTAVMRGNRKRDTRPEIAVRSALHRAGLRFRKDLRISVDGWAVRPDIVFTRRRIAVFVDGCFWHRCPEHGTEPQVNIGYWRPKLQRNVTRDREVDRALRAAGWIAVRVWEHEDPAEAADRIAKQARRRPTADALP
jgi:DNA mismatch endonuclease (patch repair protein)